MSQGKLWAVHLEADTLADLKTKLAAAAAQLEGAPAGKAAAPEKKAAAPEKAPEAPAKPAASGAKLEDVMGALTKLKEAVDAPDAGKAKKGLAAVKGVLKGFGVTNSTDLKEDQYDAVIAAAGEAIPKEDEGF